MEEYTYTNCKRKATFWFEHSIPKSDPKTHILAVNKDGTVLTFSTLSMAMYTEGRAGHYIFEACWRNDKVSIFQVG